MPKISKSILGSATLAIALAVSSIAIADGATCLRYDDVTSIHKIDSQHVMLEVEDGSTIYLLTVEARCFGNAPETTLAIEESGSDGCMRTTDRVSHGRRQCRIEDVILIESEAQLREVLRTSQ